MVLFPFDVSDAGTVSSWAETPAEVRSWCGRDEAPLPATVVAGWGREEDVRAFVLRDRSTLLAYGELWVDDDEREVELARLIVDPALRRRGIGRRLVEGLVQRALRLHPLVFLRVEEENAQARRCYEAAGFTRASSSDEDDWNRDQRTAYVWMVRDQRGSMRSRGPEA